MTDKATALASMSDSELVATTISGSARAFDELTKRYKKAAYAVAFSIVADKDAAQDVLQETFLAAYTQINTLKDSDSFGAWLCGIARNHAKRARRSAFRTSSREISLPLAEVAVRSPQEDGPADNLLNALASLTEKQSSVITLHYMEGYSIAECAQFLQVPEGTIKRRLHDARLKLKTEMTDMIEHKIKQFALPEDFKIEFQASASTWSTAPSICWFKDRWLLVWQDGEEWTNPHDNSKGNGPFWFYLSESADGKDWSEPKRLNIEPQWQHMPKLCVSGDQIFLHTHHHHYGLRLHRSKDLENWTELPHIHAFDVGRSDIFSNGKDIYITYPIWRTPEIGDAVEVLKSSDGGKSWTWLNQPCPSNKSGVTDASGISVGKRLIIAWRGHDLPGGKGSQNNIWVSSSENGGMNWSDPIAVDSLSTDQGSFSLQLLSAPNGNIAIAQEICTDQTSGTGEIWVAISKDGGKTWSDKGIYSGLRSPAIAFTRDSRLIIAGSLRTGGQSKPWIVHSKINA